jgi:hypothetical protein
MLFITGKSTLNVTKNWWGTSDLSHVLSRILDQRRIPELIRFEIEPILITGSFNCRNVNNCSSQGECIGPDNCRCASGRHLLCNIFHIDILWCIDLTLLPQFDWVRLNHANCLTHLTSVYVVFNFHHLTEHWLSSIQYKYTLSCLKAGKETLAKVLIVPM